MQIGTKNIITANSNVGLHQTEAKKVKQTQKICSCRVTHQKYDFLQIKSATFTSVSV